ncbi:FMN-dependent NADH-azoreductase [Dokdonella sp.]|uniref:FMN-dependent NADH-azoreductase n=1 Tax=Dokdonella sp. TaxID=2291710 RepID=UPI001AFD04EB|nr:FMN-dependent NADH-azoreductase [Dokdonella sp.]MBO9663355.1 FMN-dependent NADH-azoreductase [Dokdonella sp.]
MSLLHIDSSALGAHSVSRELSAALVEAWKRRNPGAKVVYRDLAANPLPHWRLVADANDPAMRENGAVLEEFLAADTVVIGAPMYNFGIPSSLKAWIDRIAIAGKTFRYTEKGPEGLAGGKKIVVASSRGGIYSEGSPYAAADFQEAYLRQVFGFLGIADVEFVRAEGVNLGPEQKAQAIASAHDAIEDCARLAA